MGSGASHEASDAAADDMCFYTRTDSLDVWLHQERFRYELHAIQRPYEWGKTQVEGLLETVAKAAKAAHAHGGDAVVKLSEVVLLQNVEGSQKQAHLESLQSPSWHKGGIDGARTVQIIDGQQRITTLVLIAAVSQHVLRELAAKMTDEHAEQRKLANQAVQHLHERFSFPANDDPSGLKGLLWRPGQSGGLADGMFNFDADEADVSVFDEDLAWLLQTESLYAGANQGPYKANAIHIYKWLTNHLKRAGAGAARRGKAGAAAADDAAASSACAAKQAKWLLDYLEAFRTRVLWTTTLTTSWRLAMHTFLNVNLDSHRVPLKVMDVIKVTLVSDFNKKRQLTSALMKWDECITQLKTCAAKVAAKAADSQFPYLLFLGSGRSLQARGILSDLVAVSDAVIRDCLCHVQAIEKCLASTRANQGVGSSPSVNLANLYGTGADLAQHFAEQCVNQHDQASYLKEELLPYVHAYCTMLSWQVQSKTGDHELRPATRASLIALLSLPASGLAKQASQEVDAQDIEPEKAECTWRPAAMAIIRELARENGLVEEASSGQSLLSKALKQLECVALTNAVSRTTAATRSAMYERIITAVSQAGSNNASKELKKLIENNGLCQQAFKDVPVGLRAGSICLIEQLFTKDAYSLWRGKLAKAVLLILEDEIAHRPECEAGTVQLWQGKMQLEHLLPQRPDPKDSYWPERFGKTGDNTHSTFAHLLGNLSLIVGRDNLEISNKDFEFKMLKISTEWNLKYRTLQPVQDVWDKKNDADYNGWDMRAVLERHKWLLQQLADRYKITVQPQQWAKWSEDLNLGSWEKLTGSQELKTLLDEWGAAAAAVGKGAVSLTGDTTTLNSLSESIQDMVKRVAQCKALNHKHAEDLLRCLHSAPQQKLSPLTSTAPPFKPRVSSLYLFDQQARAVSYSDFTAKKTGDGYSWGRKRTNSRLSAGGTLEKVTHYRQADGEQRRLWRIVQKEGTQGEGAAQPSDPSEGPYRYFLVEYVKYGTSTTDRAPCAAPEQSGDGAAGGDPGAEQQQASPAPAGVSAGVAERGAGGTSGTSSVAKRGAEEGTERQQQQPKRQAVENAAMPGAAAVARAAAAGGGSVSAKRHAEQEVEGAEQHVKKQAVEHAAAAPVVPHTAGASNSDTAAPTADQPSAGPTGSSTAEQPQAAAVPAPAADGDVQPAATADVAVLEAPRQVPAESAAPPGASAAAAAAAAAAVVGPIESGDSAGGRGAVSLTDPAVLSDLPPRIQAIVRSAEKTASLVAAKLQPLAWDAAQLLQWGVKAQQLRKLPVSSSPPDKPEVGSLYLFDSLVTDNFKEDGYQWGDDHKIKLPADETVEGTTASENRQGERLRRCIWSIKQESAAQVEGGAQLSEPMACSRFRLVLYTKGSPKREKPSAKEAGEGAADGSPGAEQQQQQLAAEQQAPQASPPAGPSAGAPGSSTAAGTTGPSTAAGPSAPSPSAKRSAEQEAEGEEQRVKWQAVEDAASTPAVPQAAAGGASNAGTPAAGAAGQPSADPMGSSTAEQPHAAQAASGDAAAGAPAAFPDPTSAATPETAAAPESETPAKPWSFLRLFGR